MGRVRLLTCVIVEAKDPSLSNELATGTALYCTVSKREEAEKERKRGEREMRTWASAVVSISWCFRFEGEMVSYPGWLSGLFASSCSLRLL